MKTFFFLKNIKIFGTEFVGIIERGCEFCLQDKKGGTVSKSLKTPVLNTRYKLRNVTTTKNRKARLLTGDFYCLRIDLVLSPTKMRVKQNKEAVDASCLILNAKVLGKWKATVKIVL